MQTSLSEEIRNSDIGREAESILRKCVHCGFCLATCPTYGLLGDERDSPRGRIYLIKQVLEGKPPSREQTQLHLDRCLTCRSCETTCPSGVEYGKLLDIGREMVDKQAGRGLLQRAQRRLLREALAYRKRFAFFMALGRLVRPVLPGILKRQVPIAAPAGVWPGKCHSRTMLVLQGCVQPTLAPSINAAAARVLDQLGISLVAIEDNCCGALSHHLTATSEAESFMRRNIDAWWPYLEQGAEAVVVTASGCGATVKEYGHLLRRDAAYAEKAARVSEITLDLSEVISRELQKGNRRLQVTDSGRKIAFQSPCTLQHGQKINGLVERILENAGFELVPVVDGHLCCGSAGTYSLLQPGLSSELKANKLKALTRSRPDVIATANIGCLMHLQADAEVPVQHWIELLDPGKP